MITVRDPDFGFENTCVTVGKFDALHIGHKALMERMNLFRDRGMKTTVLRLEMAGEPDIRTEQERTELLEALGIDIYIRMPFTGELAHMSAEEFIRDILVGRLGVKALVVGDDFRFGYERKGDAALLAREGKKYGYETVVLERIKCDGEIVSSSLIRQLIREKRLEEAYRMLG